MRFPSIFPYSSGHIAVLRVFSHLFLFCLFLFNFSYFSIPLLILCLLQAGGYFQKISSILLVLFYIGLNCMLGQVPPIWILYCFAIFIFYPNANLFSLTSCRSSSLWINALSQRIYSVVLILLALMHFSVFIGKSSIINTILYSQDPWSQAFPFFSAIPIAMVQICCGVLAFRKGLTLKLWTFSSILSLCSLIFLPSTVSASFFLFHLFLFRLSFFPSTGKGGLLIYDGECGVCHQFIRFLLREDFRRGLYYVSNQDPSLSNWKIAYKELPYDKTVIFAQRQVSPLLRMEAIITILFYLGGFWAFIAHTLNLIPLPFMNLCYRAFAFIRRFFLPRPSSLCPLTPPEWREQFKIPEGLL